MHAHSSETRLPAPQRPTCKQDFGPPENASCPIRTEQKQVPAETCTPQRYAAAAPHTSCPAHNSLTLHPSCGLRPNDHPTKHVQPLSALALPTDPRPLRPQQLLQLLGAASPVDQAPKLLDITLQGPGGSVEVKAQATLGRILQERTPVLQAGRHTHTRTKCPQIWISHPASLFWPPACTNLLPHSHRRSGR